MTIQISGSNPATSQSLSSEGIIYLWTKGSWFEVKATDGTLYSSSNSGQLVGHITALKKLHPLAQDGDLFLHVITTDNAIISASVYAAARKNGVTLKRWYATYRINSSGQMEIKFS